MYETHFGLRQRPFRATPDPEFYYPATSHEQALALLAAALDEGDGMALLTGAPGTGKTLLGHCLLERLSQDRTTAFLTNSHVRDRAGMFQAILYDLSLPYEGRSEQELRLALTDFLLSRYTAGQRMLLVIDEAHHLSVDLLEELRLLGNLEGRRGKALAVVLIAQPCLMETLHAPVLEAFRQRLAVRTYLEPFGVHEAADYLVHQLRSAGGCPDQIITDEALEVLARATQGLPRLLNRAGHQALALAYAGQLGRVDAEVAVEALAALDLPGDQVPTEGLASSTADTPEALECECGPEAVLHVEEDAHPDDGPDSASPRDPGRLRRLFAPPRRPA